MKIYDINQNVIGEIYDMIATEMTISKNGLELIKYFEGFRSKPYLCPAGVPTIGYGSTYYANGTKVTLSDDDISEADATSLLEYQVMSVYGEAVNRYTTVMNNQNHFDALTSFTYNLGEGNLKSSTLLKKHNLGDYAGAGDEFLKWVYSNGKVLQGLVERRESERKLYLS